jgi:hypothetical protein
MAIINAAYDVLSDPIKRKLHDEWIAKMEDAEDEIFTANINTPPPPPPVSPKNTGSTFDFYNHISSYWLLYLIVGVFIWGLTLDNASTSKSKQSTHNIKQDNKAQNNTNQIKEWLKDSQNTGKQNNSPIAPKYIRPLLAPNGQPWPNKSGYIKGYNRLFLNGFSNVTIDNSKNDSDVFLKFISLDASQLLAIQQYDVFI